MTAQPANMTAFIDACRDSVAREIASIRREAERERELRDAQFSARMAELDARISAVSELERKMADRLATLKDGEPGRDGRDGVDGKDGADGANGADGRDGTDGQNGKDGTSVTVDDVMPELMEAALEAAAVRAAEIVEGWERPKDGRDGVDGADGTSVTAEDVAPMIAAEVERILSTWERPKDGEPGKDGRDGVDGKDGETGERGPEGPAGALPIVSAWADRVYYQGEVCESEGSVWQARVDTGKAPGHEDWACIVSRGKDGEDGRTPNIRGTYDENAAYVHLDVVALNGASFVAKRDDPGACPGEGWQLMAAQGKAGKPGMKGDTGVGVRGLPGPGLQSVEADDSGVLTFVNADGTRVQCDLYQLLSRLG